MWSLKGKASDKIRSGGGAHTSPERPDMEKTKVNTPHEGHQLSPPNRRLGKGK